MGLQIISLLAGFILVIVSADRLVYGAAALARNLGIPPLIIGLTVVAFGTSAPEILVSAIAAIQGNGGLSIGNAIGSNIANIALVIGATALVLPLAVTSDTMRREFPILFAIMLMTLVLMVDGTLSPLDGIILIGSMMLLTYWLITLGIRSGLSDPIGTEYEKEIPTGIATKVALAWLLGGFIVLLSGSRLVVWSSINLAHIFGVSDLVIGLTIVAIGTSLPELATSLVSAFKREHDIAVGNILGSNMFNLLAVLSLPGLFGPEPVQGVVLNRDIPVMIAVTLLLFAMSYGFGRSGTVGRIKGGVLFSIFLLYQANLYMGWV